jgi:very-short-patch-repair endonuclease
MMILCHMTTMRRPIIPYNPKLKERARFLRNNSTKSEQVLWKYLKGKQILGFDFHRQRSVVQYIIDFFCQELYLGIELDGYTHHFIEKAKKDVQREKRLSKFGVKIIRFWDDEVFKDLDNVLRVIKNTVEERKTELSLN